MKNTTFSDSWHLVADKHACLLPSVESHKQYFRGERWYVLKAPFKNEFFRLTEAGYHFVARMTLDKTIDEAWREAMEHDPDEAPGQQEVIQMLGQLSSANLIHSDIAADSHQLYKAHKKRQRKMTQMQLMNFLFLKVPLFNPDRLLEFLKPLGKLFINPLAAIVWLGTVLWALKLVFENFSAATNQSSGFLAPENIPMILVVTIVLKAIHELSHGIFCKHYGGYVPTVGVMFILFAPLPFVDATASWGFRSRFQRIAVSFAGMYAELFIAALATFVWVSTGHGTVNSLAYNVMLIASVTTVLFNFNPLLKFDGYFIFSDVFELPNLQQRGNKFLQFILEYSIFGYKDAVNPARSRREWPWLGGYAIAAAIYRVFLMTSIALILGERFFEIGLVLAAFTLGNYILTPLFKFFRYLSTSPNLYRHRKRAWSFVILCFAGLVVLLGVIPISEHFQEPGIVWAKNRMNVTPEVSGRVATVHQQPGVLVKTGDLLITLENTDLQFQIEEAKSAVKQAEARYAYADSNSPASVAPLRKLAELEKEKLAQLVEKASKLEVRAPQSGLWISPQLEELHGSWIQRGTTVGRIGSHDEFEFIAIISQKEAANLYNQSLEKAEVRIWGQAGEPLPVTITKIAPGEQQQLPSAALGWLGGGQVEVDQQDPEGKQTTEPFFQITAQLPTQNTVTLFDERSGKMRITLGERPLLFQWIHDLRKLLQRRLRI